MPWPLNLEQLWPSEEGKEKRRRKEGRQAREENEGCLSLQSMLFFFQRRGKKRGQDREKCRKKEEEEGEEEGKGRRRFLVLTSSNLYGVTKKSVPPARDLRVVRARRSVPSSTWQR